MGFFDLSIPYSDSGDKEVVVGKSSRLKLATKAMELGYVGIAHNRSIKGVMSEKDSCTIPLLTLGSLLKVAPRLASSVGFHRDLLGVPRATPFRQYTRLTVHVETKAQCQCLNSGNPILKSYDIVAVRPLTQNAFNDVCETAEVDLISIDFDKMPFRLKHPMVKAAIKRGVYFEIKYYDLLKDAQTRRQVISNAKLLVDWTRGKNLIISSGALSVTELRGPNDAINLMSLLGLSTERARAAISKNCRNMIAKVLKKKRFHKEAVRVELLSSSETFSLDRPLSGDCMKWDPLSSGDGDMLLADLAKAFDDASAAAHKSSKAIDFTSVLGGLPSHGFRVKDILRTDPLTQPLAANVIDKPVQSNQVSELCLAVEATSSDNENVRQIDVQMSEDDSKVEPAIIDLKEEAVGLRKCSTRQGHGLLLQNQAGASLTLIRCAASDANKHTESNSEGKSLSPSKIGHRIPQSPVENINMDTLGVDEVYRKEGIISGQANDENHIPIDDSDMKIDGLSESIHEDMEVEEQTHVTGESNIILPNLSSESTDLLRESGKSLSPEAVREDEEQVSSLESNEKELVEEPSIPQHNTFEITIEDNKEAHVQSYEIDNATNLGIVRAKRSRVRLPQLHPFKPFLLQSRFKRISIKRKT